MRHRIALKNRIHATLLAFGRPCPTADLFGPSGRALLARLGLPEPWAGTTAAAVARIDDLDAQIDGCERRGPLAKNGPKYLRWALIEAATHAARHPIYRDHDEATKRRLGRQRGPAVARVEVARKLAEAIWHMLTKQERFAPARPHAALVA